MSKKSGGASRAATTLTGILLAIVAMVCFAALDTVTKYVSVSVPVFMAI